MLGTTCSAGSDPVLLLLLTRSMNGFNQEILVAASDHFPGLSEDEQEKYNSLINTINGFEEYTLDTFGNIVSCHVANSIVSGYDEQEVFGKHISILYPDDSTFESLEHLDKAKELGEITLNGIRLKKKGQPFWCRMKIITNLAEDQSFDGFTVRLQDTTYRALSNMRIRTMKDEYFSILNNPFIGIIKFRLSDLVVVMLNEKAKEILGEIDFADSTTISISKWFDSLSELNEFKEQLKNNKQIERFMFCTKNNLTKQITYIELSVKCYHLQDFAEGVIFDVTDKQHQLQELTRLNSDLDNFTYHASHDLRSPLTTIRGLLNLSYKESAIEEVHKYSQMIEERVNRLDVLLKDLIAVTYNNKVSLVNAPIDFREEVNALLNEMSPGEIDLRYQVKVDQKQGFQSDLVRVRTILRNLISNSHKYQREDATMKLIRLNVKVEAAYAAIQLQDNGIGIEHEFKHKIFNMFVRATTKSTGTGLGLYIVKSMIEKLGGFISLESTINEGTTVLLIIPNLIHKDVAAN
jgi:PAS domain S-box-containing protein